MSEMEKPSWVPFIIYKCPDESAEKYLIFFTSLNTYFSSNSSNGNDNTFFQALMEQMEPSYQNSHNENTTYGAHGFSYDDYIKSELQKRKK